MNLPRVLILSTSNIDNAQKIAREMGSEHITDVENLRCFLWMIENKYYSARVLLCVTDVSSMNSSPCEAEAIILHHDPKTEKNTECLEKYLPLVHALTKADIFLLACESFQDAKVKDEVAEWAQINKFELVEMKRPDSSDVTDEEEIEDNMYGIQRITEALHTHLWPNRIIKADSPNSRIESTPNVETVEDQLENIRLNAETRESSDQLLMESVLDGIMGEENTDFGELFGRLMDMKERVSSLTSNNRRAAAEQLVTAFWKAMGGDPSEVEDLDQ